MLTGKKIRLILSPEQERYFRRAAGSVRWIYNEYVRCKYACKISVYEFKKLVTKIKKLDEYSWLQETAFAALSQGLLDADRAFTNWFKGISKQPRFHSKRDKQSFALQKKNFKYVMNGCHIEKVGAVRTSEPLPKLPKGTYLNPRVVFDGKYWYVTFSYEVPNLEVELNDDSLGIDLGVKALAVVVDSSGQSTLYANINKTDEVKRLKKILKREQRKCARKRENNIERRIGNKIVWKRPLKECKNINRNNRKIRLLYKKLTDIRINYLHQVTTEIVRTKPSRIVMEDLNVRGMMKNKHLSAAIQEQGFYKFRSMIEYKAKRYGISVVFVPRFYPSSKTCSVCGHVKQDLKLSDRIYKCSECGLIVDRDVNAAINLAKYQE